MFCLCFYYIIYRVLCQSARRWNDNKIVVIPHIWSITTIIYSPSEDSSLAASMIPLRILLLYRNRPSPGFLDQIEDMKHAFIRHFQKISRSPCFFPAYPTDQRNFASGFFQPDIFLIRNIFLNSSLFHSLIPSFLQHVSMQHVSIAYGENPFWHKALHVL